MIRIVEGDFFDFDADIRVNTVNCVGVMGAGVALAFKKKYPEMYKEYKNACSKGEVRPGQPHVWYKGDMFSKGITIINFPTKDHWRKPSEYEYVEIGLIWLRDYLKKYSNEFTITVPALGCGHGGLEWNLVKEMIRKYLGDLEMNVLVFEPKSSLEAAVPHVLNLEDSERLAACGVKTILPDADNFPSRLKVWSENRIYVSGNVSNSVVYDISIITSSSPDEKEKAFVLNLAKQLQAKNKSVILGPSRFDQELVESFIENEVRVGMAIPSGIVLKCERDGILHKMRSQLTIFSLGNPFLDFDRKQFIPATLLRLYLSDTVILTTPSLDWVNKYKKHFFRNNKVFFVRWNLNDKELYNKLEELGAVALEPNSINCSFHF